MKKSMSLLAIPLLLMGLASCNQAAPVVNTDTKGDNNKAVVDKFLKAIRSGDIKTASDQLADNFMGYGPSIKDSSNREQFVDLWTKRWETELATVTYGRYGNVAVTIDSADWVSEWGRINATYKNGLPPIKFEYHGAFRMENGKIAMSAVFYNVADILEQQGYAFVPPGEKKDEKKK
jgi:hypothetical protein